MRIIDQTLDSLRKLVRSLQEENASLKALLDENNIAYENEDVFENEIPDEYDEDQGDRIQMPEITEERARDFYKVFWWRPDVYAKRGKKGGFFPQCDNGYNDNICPKRKGERSTCDADCEYKQWRKIEAWNVVNHLKGIKDDCTDVLGAYPLWENNTCRFLVFDFDNHEKGAYIDDYANHDELWKDEVDALRTICSENGIEALVERSKSGRGAHIWIFFSEPITGALARSFGFALLDKGAKSVKMPSFKFYDRMFPSQSEAKKLGNLIALPLQGKALKEGNSAFVDENWNAYPDQWTILMNVRHYGESEIIEELQKGYKYHNIVVRHSMVKVAN